MDALIVNNIVKTFGRRDRQVKAVRGVSFNVKEGEIYSLLGMNGAGKSTTIKICTGLIAADEGNVSVYGHNIVKEVREAKSILNVSPQETAVAQNLTVAENLVFIARAYGAEKGEAKAAAEEMIEKLSLEDKIKDRAGTLSGGLMRRLSIGMALITKPKLVFLDEPTLGLDVVARRELWRLISDIKRDAAVVLTTHYMEEAERLSDRIGIMKKGKIIAEGTANELKSLSGESDFEEAFLKLSGEGGEHNE